MQIEAGEFKTTPARGGIEYYRHHYLSNEARVRIGVKGSIIEDYEDHENIDSSETDLLETELPRETFLERGFSVAAHYAGIISGTVDNKSFNYYIDGNLVFQTKDFTMSNESPWTLDVRIIANSSTSVRFSCTFNCNLQNNATPFVSCGYAELGGLTLTDIIKVRLTGTGANNGDTILKTAEFLLKPKSNL